VVITVAVLRILFAVVAVDTLGCLDRPKHKATPFCLLVVAEVLEAVLLLVVAALVGEQLVKMVLGQAQVGVVLNLLAVQRGAVGRLVRHCREQIDFLGVVAVISGVVQAETVVRMRHPVGVVLGT
jgi:hypothetical protein